MAYRRQPYGGWRNQGRGGADDDDDDYAAQNQRAVYGRQPPYQRAVYDRQPRNQPAVYGRHEKDADNNNNDNDNDEKKDEETVPKQQAQPAADAPAAAQPANKQVDGYRTSAYDKPAYDYSSRYSNYNMNERTTRATPGWSHRRGAADGYPAGYGQYDNYDNEKNASSASAADDDDEQIRQDFANRFTLSPQRQHVVQKKPGEASHGQPQVTVVKELKLYLEHNKIENFAFNKKMKGKGKKVQDK